MGICHMTYWTSIRVISYNSNYLSREFGGGGGGGGGVVMQ